MPDTTKNTAADTAADTDTAPVKLTMADMPQQYAALVYAVTGPDDTDAIAALLQLEEQLFTAAFVSGMQMAVNEYAEYAHTAIEMINKAEAERMGPDGKQGVTAGLVKSSIARFTNAAGADLINFMQELAAKQGIPFTAELVSIKEGEAFPSLEMADEPSTPSAAQ